MLSTKVVFASKSWWLEWEEGGGSGDETFHLKTNTPFGGDHGSNSNKEFGLARQPPPLVWIGQTVPPSLDKRWTFDFLNPSLIDVWSQCKQDRITAKDPRPPPPTVFSVSIVSGRWIQVLVSTRWQIWRCGKREREREGKTFHLKIHAATLVGVGKNMMSEEKKERQKGGPAFLYHSWICEAWCNFHPIINTIRELWINKILHSCRNLEAAWLCTIGLLWYTAIELQGPMAPLS